MRIHAQALGVGWIPCLPFDYSRMWGEPIAQCNSISDQTPCMAGEGPLAAEGYCPATMPGYAGLGLGVAPNYGVSPADPAVAQAALLEAYGVSPTTTPDITGTIISSDPTAEPCAPGLVLYGGACIPVGSPALQQTPVGVPAVMPMTNWCAPGLVFYGGACIPAGSPALQQTPVTSRSAQPDWTKVAMIAGGVVLALTLLAMVRR